ncbi:MAG: hypothetical protein AAF502_00890 [Bacteroidota bacterium]
MCLLVCFFHQDINAQIHSKSFSIDVSISPEAGRWIYNRGQDEDGVFRGFDRSFLSFLVAYEVGLNYRINRIRTGIRFTYRMLIEDQLIRSQQTRFNSERYQVTDANAVKLPTIFVDLGYDLVRYPNFSLVPMVSFGYFNHNSTHPEKENFGFRFAWSAGFINEFHRKRFSYFLHPHYTSYVIYPKEQLYPGELNQIYSLGFKFGVRWWIV